MYTLHGTNLSFSVDEKGFNTSLFNHLTNREYVKVPGEMWKIIYKDGQRTERPIFGRYHTPVITATDNRLKLVYNGLHSDDKDLDATFTIELTMTDELSATMSLQNRSEFEICEIHLTPFSGAQSVDGNPAEDYIIWPYKMGKKFKNPAFTDLSTKNGFRTYEMPEYEHTDLNILYPGIGSMQWFDWGNDNEGVYIGSHDATHQTVCLRVERNVNDNVLRFGVIKYPLAKPGEDWDSEPLVVMVHKGNWHAGSKRYRKFLADSNTWSQPNITGWAKEFQGFLRLIMKPQYCDPNWTYHDIPALFDKTREAGLNTLYLMGWQNRGFGRMRPHYEVDEEIMGGREVLQKGIDYVHGKGGKIVLFISYFAIDHKSDFYLKEGGDKCTVKTIWGEDLAFAETYAAEATYRKICNPPRPTYQACSGADGWHKKMMEVVDYCMKLGVDGVCLDLGGTNSYFCYAENHAHKKPSHSNFIKDKRYKELHELVKKYGDDKILFMEYVVDIFNQHMDFSQPSQQEARTEKLPTIYRYTFPEYVFTNRGMAMDEKKYKDNINYSFIYGLAFDLSIHRCRGLPEAIPNYIAYMKEILQIRKDNAEYLIHGKFVDDEGYSIDHPDIQACGYQAADGSVGVAMWNWGKETVTFTLKGASGSQTITLDADAVTFAKA